MKKITAFVGSAHKKNTHKAVMQFMNNLKELGEIEYEIVTLSDYTLGQCRGCRLCFEKGEEFCPLKDDRDILFDKINASDGVVFATPNYCFQMSGIMKVFVDRFGFSIHRPRYIGKAFTSIVSQGFARGERILQDLDFTASLLGFNTTMGATVTGFDPMTDKQRKKADKDLKALSKRFTSKLAKSANFEPSLFQLISFRIGRSMIKLEADRDSVDYKYYADRGWISSDYFYPTHLNFFKRASGNLLDSIAGVLRKVMA
jgi:multimeric flavodoxin WrbA